MFAVNIPFYLETEVVHYTYIAEFKPSCTNITNKEIYFILRYLLPLSVMLVLYWTIHLDGNRTIGETQNVVDGQRNKEFTHLILFVVTIFLICWLPIHIALVLRKDKYFPVHLIMALLSFYCLAYMSF